MVVCLFYLASFVCIFGCTNQQGHAEESKSKTTIIKDKNDEVIEAWVMLLVEDTRNLAVGVRIRDKKTIDDSVLSPLAKASVDPRPAKYEILGSLLLKHKDGSQTSYTLYAPWGHISRDGKYYIADLNEIRTVTKKALRSVPSP